MQNYFLQGYANLNCFQEKRFLFEVGQDLDKAIGTSKGLENAIKSFEAIAINVEEQQEKATLLEEKLNRLKELKGEKEKAEKAEKKLPNPEQQELDALIQELNVTFGLNINSIAFDLGKIVGKVSIWLGEQPFKIAAGTVGGLAEGVGAVDVANVVLSK